jgi:hypothetical protein
MLGMAYHARPIATGVRRGLKQPVPCGRIPQVALQARRRPDLVLGGGARAVGTGSALASQSWVGIGQRARTGEARSARRRRTGSIMARWGQLTFLPPAR